MSTTKIKANVITAGLAVLLGTGVTYYSYKQYMKKIHTVKAPEFEFPQMQLGQDLFTLNKSHPLLQSLTQQKYTNTQQQVPKDTQESPQLSQSQETTNLIPITVDGEGLAIPETSVQNKEQKPYSNSKTTDPTKNKQPKYVCQLYPLGNSELYCLAYFSGNQLTNMICESTGREVLTVSLHQFGDVSESQNSLGRKLAQLGSIDTKQHKVNRDSIINDLAGRGLLLSKEDQPVALGVIGHTKSAQ